MKTVLIALDGATFTVLDPLMERGVMPFLAGLTARGVRAPLRSTVHPLTPPAFASMTTGRSPGNHGVFDFTRSEERGDGYFFTLCDSRDIRCETVWSLAGRAGLRSTVLNFVLTAPPEPIPGCVVPGMVHHRHLRRHVHPPELFPELKAIDGFDAKTLSWEFSDMERAIFAVPDSEYLAWISHQAERERQWFEVLRRIGTTRPADLTAIVFDGMDKIQHICWELLDPVVPADGGDPWEREVRRAIDAFFFQLDGFIRRIAVDAGPETRVVIASDHGFGPSTLRFRVNSFLRSLGHLAWREGGDADAQDGGDVLNLDWSKTVAFTPTRSCNGICIRQAARPGAPGVPPAEYAGFRARLADALRSVRNPTDGTPVVTETLFREDAFPGPASAAAPDITMVLSDRGNAFISEGGSVVETRDRVRGTHYPDGVIIAAGPGIRAGARAGKRSILDVAPLLLHSLGLPVPSNLEGTVPEEFFEKEYAAAHPVAAGPPAAEGGDGSGAALYGENERAEIYDQLRALGYMDDQGE